MNLVEKPRRIAAVPARTGGYSVENEAARSPARTPGEFLSRAFDEDLIQPGFSWHGRVAFVFSRASVAANLLNPGNPSLYLTLLPGQQTAVPMGVAQIPKLNSLQPGEMVSLENRVLRCGGLPPVELSGPGTRLRISRRLSITREALLVHLSALGELASRAGFAPGRFCPSPGAEACLANRLRSSLSEIVTSLGNGGSALRGAVSRVTGLGPGLTPSGDDMLTGVLAEAIVLAGSGLLEQESLEGLRAAVRLANETTPVALGMRAHALRGVFLPPLREIVEVLGDPGIPSSSVLRIARELTAHGEQSGQDMLTGVTALAWTVANRKGTA